MIMDNINNGSNIDLFNYALTCIDGINSEAIEKLDNASGYLMERNPTSAAELLDVAETKKKSNIHSRARVENSLKNEDFGIWEYHYAPDGQQRTVDWMLENDPSYFMEHIAGCRNRGRGQVYRMDNLQDYANEKLFGSK